jgi:hypothetical protein
VWNHHQGRPVLLFAAKPEKDHRSIKVMSAYIDDATAKAVLVDPQVVKPKIVCIDVPSRYVNGGLDIKFEEDPFNVPLHGIMTAGDYEASIRDLNERLVECRASKVDFALIGMSPLLLPLVYFALRSKKQKKLRRSIIRQFVVDFNRQYPHLVMRWSTRPMKVMMIMKRQDYDAIENS